MNEALLIIGYSGHAYVAVDIFHAMGRAVAGYCESEEKTLNPFQLRFHGSELSKEGLEMLRTHSYFIAIGSNTIRKKVYHKLQEKGLHPASNAMHPSAIISNTAQLGQGIMVGSNVSINALATIGDGVICNTGCIIEHECQIGNFAHIAPGAILAGNVTVGAGTFVGANSVVKQGIAIGENVVIGAGSVIIRDIPDGATVVGNPGRIIKQK